MRGERPEALLRGYFAWEPKTDKLDFQWRARLLQSAWRHRRGFAVGQNLGKRRGACLEMPFARESLANYLTPAIRDLVRMEVEDAGRARGKLYKRPRIYNNLLSSQPLCFNLFGELALDLELATAVFEDLSGGRAARVTSIGFEHSPGRSDPRYTGDKSAFDVYVRFETPLGRRGFAGVEVKYHERLNDAEATLRQRHEEIALEMGCFDVARLDALRTRPLEQIWRDHLLVGAHKSVDAFDDAFFVFLHPAQNSACAAAVQGYAECLEDPSSFLPWTLEAVVAALKRQTSAPWVDAFTERYLDFDALDSLAEPAQS